MLVTNEFIRTVLKHELFNVIIQAGNMRQRKDFIVWSGYKEIFLYDMKTQKDNL